MALSTSFASMHGEPDPNLLRRSALDLLASGNGVESVAHVLGVPVATVADWARDGPDTRPAGGAAAAPPTPPQLPTIANERPRHPHIEPTGFFPHRRATKVVMVGVPLALTALVLCSHLDETFRDANLWTIYRPMMAIGLLIGAYFVACGLRGGFELTRQAVVFQNVFGRSELAFADIDCYRVRRNRDLGVYTLSLYPRSGATRRTIWFDGDEVTSPDIAGWLSSLRVAGRETIPGVASPAMPPVGRAGDASSNLPLVVAALLCCVLVARAGSSLIDSLRMVVEGPPARASLTVVEGRLVEVPECQRVRQSRFQVLKVDTGSAIVERKIPCLIDPSRLTVPATWQVTLLSDDRVFAGHQVYEVALGSRPLRSYERFARVERDGAKSDALVYLLMVVVFIPIVVLLCRTFFGTRAR